MYDFILPVMEEAARLMLSAHDIDAAVTVKPGDANFVTAYDVAVWMGNTNGFTEP